MRIDGLELIKVEPLNQGAIYSFGWYAGPSWARYIVLRADSPEEARKSAVTQLQGAMEQQWLRGRGLFSVVDGAHILAIDYEHRTVRLNDGRLLDEDTFQGMAEADEIVAVAGEA